ncbi:hypothetical protein RHSP_72570 [Rhizobium freirei PRF 81]|uniref:Uncharacterized protein n=1 Tax=Rhizobium freirei PRF 81 TaxID=363754 RepID=N6TVN3_9HYPH|nr:hypothetical protein RHSP_72570 [Rhizobium freirei PRF 81]
MDDPAVAVEAQDHRRAFHRAEHDGHPSVGLHMGRRFVAAAGSVEIDGRVRGDDAQAQRFARRNIDPRTGGRRRGKEDVLPRDEIAQPVVDAGKLLCHGNSSRSRPCKDRLKAGSLVNVLQAWFGRKRFSGVVAIQKFLRRKGAEVCERRAQAVVIPIPPGEPVHARSNLGRETLADQLGRNAADDRVGGHILGDDGACTDDGTIADRDARQDGGAVTDPDVMTDEDAVVAPPGEEIRLHIGIRPIIGGAIGEVMQRCAPCRMVGGVDAYRGGNVDELADRRTPDRAILHDVGIVADLDLVDAAAVGDFGIAAERRVVDAGRRADEGRFAQFAAHAAAFLGENCDTSRMRLPTASRTSSSWKMPRRATPASFFCSIMSTTTARLRASSDAVGSSSRRMAWSVMKPRAMLTRCCSPPEKVAGGNCQSSGGRFSWASNSAARSRASATVTPRASSGSATTSMAATRGTVRRNWLT